MPRTEKAKILNEKWAELARVLRLPRNQLRVFRTMPGAPVEPDERAWRVFMEAALPEYAKPTSEPRTLEEAKLARVVAQTKLDNVKLARARGDLVPLAEIHEVHAAVWGMAVNIFRQRIETDLPMQAEGRSVPEIRKLARSAVDDTLRAIQRGIEEWDEKRQARAVAEIASLAPEADAD